jgi:glucose-1-phosphate thymidylyltransferase
VKGVVLAGGLGWRLRSLTGVTNKHLLPVRNGPMAFHPICLLAEANITDIMIVTEGNGATDLLYLIGQTSDSSSSGHGGCETYGT